MGVIIPGRVACTCPSEGAEVTLPHEGTLAFRTGAWRLLDAEGRPSADEETWAPTACPHGLVDAQAWPLASDLASLSNFLVRHDDPDRRALAELIAAFGRRPGESGELQPLAFEVDERHARALDGLGPAFATTPGPWLVDSDTDETIAGASRLHRSGPLASGFVTVRSPPSLPLRSFIAPFDQDGLRLQLEGRVKLAATRIEQEAIEGGVRWTDLDTGETAEATGWVVTGWARDPTVHRHVHIRMGTLPTDLVAQAREDLGALVAAALRTGHPIELPDRFGVPIVDG